MCGRRLMNMPAGHDIRKPKMKPIYLGYFNLSDFFCKGINKYYRRFNFISSEG
jgi:hypothetical protein